MNDPDYDQKVGTKWIHGRMTVGDPLLRRVAQGTAITKSGPHAISGTIPDADATTVAQTFTTDLDDENRLTDLQIGDGKKTLTLVLTRYDGPELTAPAAPDGAALSDSEVTMYLSSLFAV